MEKYHIPWTCSPQAHLGGLPTLSLTINSSWLPWERVAMPLIGPLMPVPHERKKPIFGNYSRFSWVPETQTFGITRAAFFYRPDDLPITKEKQRQLKNCHKITINKYASIRQHNIRKTLTQAHLKSFPRLTIRHFTYCVACVYRLQKKNKTQIRTIQQSESSYNTIQAGTGTFDCHIFTCVP